MRIDLIHTQGNDESINALMSQQGQLSEQVSTHLFPISKLTLCGQSANELMGHGFK